jgi:hypothetical protein
MVENQVKEYTFDASLDLAEGQLPLNPTAYLIDLETHETIPDAATVDGAPTGKFLSVRVTGLRMGHTYELRFGFEHSSPRVDGERTVRLHVIECVG